MYIEKDSKIYQITSLGYNGLYYFLTISCFETIPTEENFNPISSEDFRYDTTEKKKLNEIYEWLLTQTQFTGGVIVE